MPKLLKNLKAFYATSARKHLPWRHTRDPYKILISEIMLQQTQALRVVPKYEQFIKKYPSARTLARASLKDVLAVWSGLGYNRRAKFLHEAAKIVAKNDFPKKAEEIEKLPGVGHYTARAVTAFAFNKPEIFVETNIRTVFFYFGVLQKTKTISDKELLPLIAKALERSRMKPRDFYAALMDYGAFLKKEGIRLNAKSKHYSKQSRFKGSYRQLRGAILRELLQKPASLERLIEITGRKKSDVVRAIANLSGEGLITIRNHKFSIAK